MEMQQTATSKYSMEILGYKYFTNMIQVGTLEKMFYISLKLVLQNDWLAVERKCLKTLDKQQQ